MEPAILRTPGRLAGRAVLATQSDRRLVELVHSGSEAAFEAIVERYRGPLRRYCRRVGAGAPIDDVVQQTFLTAYLALTSTDVVLELRPWLYRVARNATLDALRGQARDPERLGDSHEAAERPETELERRTNLRRVLVALGDLPENQRAALVLRELEGRSREEIASELGVTRGAVRQLLYRARVGLRAAASVVVPPWVLVPEDEKVGRPGTLDRIAELAAGSGTAVGVAKAGAIVATAGAIGVAALPGGTAGPAATPTDKARERDSASPPTRPVALRGGAAVAATAPIAEALHRGGQRSGRQASKRSVVARGEATRGRTGRDKAEERRSPPGDGDDDVVSAVPPTPGAANDDASVDPGDDDHDESSWAPGDSVEGDDDVASAIPAQPDDDDGASGPAAPAPADDDDASDHSTGGFDDDQ